MTTSRLESILHKRIVKTGGSFEHTGTVVAEFITTTGLPRIVVEFDPPVAGLLHIYRPDQVELLWSDAAIAAEAAHEAKP